MLDNTAHRNVLFLFCTTFSPIDNLTFLMCSSGALRGVQPHIHRILYRRWGKPTKSTMIDTLTPRERSERMSRVRGADTKPEMHVRRLIHGMGYRYRLHRRNLPGTPDLVFTPRRKVIFVHGCYWHRHSDPHCPLARLPKSRLEFWLPKLEGNRRRDELNQTKLRKMGWKILVIWECQLKTGDALRSRIRKFLG